jgi:hypothetical protein
MTHFTHGQALIIGVGADLPNTVDDAIGLADILKDPGRCAYPPDQVQTLTGPQATRGGILDGLQALKNRAGDEAAVIVYFSGHGYEVQTPIGTQYFLMPYGYRTSDLPGTAVSGRELADALRAIPARKLLLLLDCCHAGGLDDVKAPDKTTFTKAPIPAEAVELLTQGSGRASIASCMPGELSFAGRPYSAFTRALLEALCGRGAARADGFVRVTDLALHARQVVPGRTRDRQHPILHYETGDNFRVAYYAAGDTTPKGLPFPEEADIEPEPGAFRGITVTTTTTYQGTATDHSAVAQDHSVAVAGRGVNVGGKVGGSIVTGDNNVVAGRDASAGLSGEDLDRLFAPIMAAITAVPVGQQPAAALIVEDLKAEVAKEDKADDSRLARLIDSLVGLVPGAVAGLLSAFAHPVLTGLAGPATQAILNSLR